MKPFPTKRIILAVILGLITTVTVTWGIVIMWNNGYGSWGESFRAELLVSEHRVQTVRWQRGSGTIWVWCDYYDPTINAYIVADGTIFAPSQIVDWSQVPSEVLSLCPYTKFTRVEFLRGWPKVALSCGIQGTTIDAMDHGIELDWNDQKYWLPLKPYWPGFIIDAAIYGTIWLGIFIIPGRLQHYLRERKNRCTTCGYNLHNLKSNRCPECGTTVISTEITKTP